MANTEKLHILIQIVEYSCIFFNLQSHHDELEAKFFEERAALEAKYQKLYQPLYNKVSDWSTALIAYV